MSWTYLRLANPNQWLSSLLMMLMQVDLMMSSLLQRLLTLLRTLEIFLETITKGQEVKTLLYLVPSCSSEPSVSEVVKPSVSEAVKSIEVTPPGKIRVDLQESKPKAPNLPKGKLHYKPMGLSFL